MNIKKIFKFFQGGDRAKMHKLYDEVERKGLLRYIEAQDAEEAGYACALKEMKAGSKQSHWMPYIFPLMRGLGHSSFSIRYELTSVSEAKEYLKHPVLSARLREITKEILKHPVSDHPGQFMGSDYDALKLKACMTLFDYISPHDIYGEVLDRYFEGARSTRVLHILEVGD